MSDRSTDTHDSPPEETHSEDINPSRRKLTGAALGASAIFTLSSRPVWANQCSISGMASGNISGPRVTCQGCTPGYWKVCQHFPSWGPTSFKTTDTFNRVFGVTEYKDCEGTPYTLLDVMYLNGGSYDCALDSKKRNRNANSGGAPTCTNGTAFKNLGGDPISENLGFHAVAALLSAAHPLVSYGYTSGDIITMFKNNYKTNAAALKNTFDSLNNRGCPL